MPVGLEIADGDPWWLSPNIWTVPGDDPGGAPGIPVAGKPCFLYARVRNQGRNSVTDAAVRFYWANPAVGFDRTTANLVGTSYVSLNTGQMAEVLCLMPWSPIFVNDGHECVLAEAFHPSLDPLPGIPAFNVPTDRHVAQRNLSVALAVQKMFRFTFEVHNPGRKAGRFALDTREGSLSQLEKFRPFLGKNFPLPTKLSTPQSLGFMPSSDPNERDLNRAVSVKEFTIGPNQRSGFAMVGQLKDEAAFIHVLQKVDERIVGGLSVLVLVTEK